MAKNTFVTVPRKISTSIEEVKNILLIATGLGLATILPNLEKLLDKYEGCEGRDTEHSRSVAAQREGM